MLANGQAAPSLNSFADLDSNEDGSVTVPEVLRPYMRGIDRIVP